MEEDEPNAVIDLYNTYRESFRDTYVIQSDDGLEMNAFASGVVAALSMLDMDPAEVVDNETGRSVMQDVDELLIDRANTQ